MQHKNSIIILILYQLLLCSYAQLIGDSCIIEKTGEHGICEETSKCKRAIDDLKNRRGVQPSCGPDPRSKIICCRPNLYQRISTIKCNEYQKVNNNNVQRISADGEIKNTTVMGKCSFESTPLIIGGTPAKPKEFPHMAAIGYLENEDTKIWACGGSLISEIFVLTASHCLSNRPYGKPKFIQLGNIDLNSTDSSTAIIINVAENIKHPNYTLSSTYNDIGLIKLEHSVIFNEYVRPACLIDTRTEYLKAMATGWGQIGWGPNETKSTSLQRVVLDIFSYDECRASWLEANYRKLKNGINETQFCSGSRKHEDKDTCYGDSGGPLQIYHPTLSCMYTLIGLTSFGPSCGDSKLYGINTKIYPYLTWIEEIVWS